MTRYIDPRDAANLHLISTDYGFRGYDHFSQTPNGWRQERRLAELREESTHGVRIRFAPNMVLRFLRTRMTAIRA